MKPSAFAPVQWAMNVPPILRKDGNPDDTAHHVLLVLATFANADGTSARPSITTLAEKAYKRPRVTIDALARIEAAGLISKSADLNGTTVWRLHMEVSRIGPTVLDQKRERERQQAADRQRRRRQRLAEQGPGHASAERDVTHPGCVTEPDVTHPESVSHASEERESRIPDACVTQAAPLQPLIRGGVPALDLPIDLPIDQLTPPTAAVTDAAFGEFWKAYPRKISKGAARKAWDKAIKKTDAATITVGATRFAAERKGQDPQYTPHPATWLNGERWADEPEQPQLRAVSGGYQPYQRPVDQSIYDEEL
jgi:hypothetical protein